MKHKNTLIKIIFTLVSSTAYATNGMAPTGFGNIHKGMGGAAVGNPQNTTSMISNPAAASFIEDGYDIEAEIFIPKRTTLSQPFSEEYTGDGIKTFFVPTASYKKNLNGYNAGISAYGTGGMNTEYTEKNSPKFPSPGGAGAPPAGTPIPFNATPNGSQGSTGIDLKQLTIAPNISVKLGEALAVGASVNFTSQQVNITGIQALSPHSSQPNNFTNNGNSRAYGIGVTLGIMAKPSKNVTVGMSYRSQNKMSEFKEYKGLFTNGRMDTPDVITVGTSVKITPDTTIAVDIQQTYYSDVAALGNPTTKSNNGKPVPFGEKDGPGFGWDDQTVVKVGVKTQVSDKLAVTLGYNHGKSPVDSEDTFFATLAPAVTEDHASVGFEYNISESESVIGSYIHAFDNKVEGFNDKMNPKNPKNQPFDVKMEQDSVGLGYRKKFF